MTSAGTSKSIAVIGGGIGGLSAAVHLAASGAKVTLFEKQPTLGGKLNIWEESGFVFDTGPHVLTMLFAFEDLFAAAGEKLSDHIELVRLTNICRYHFPNGGYFDAPANPLAAASAIDIEFPGSREGFLEFLKYAENVYDKTVDTFLTQDISVAMRNGGLGFTLGRMTDFLSLKPFQSLDRRIATYIKDQRLQQIFRLYALYSGSHPKRCSGIFSTVAHVQWNLGTYYVVGGLYRLVDAIEKLLHKLNVTIHIQTEVTKVNEKSRGSIEIETISVGGGDSHSFSGVICNQDRLTASGLSPKLKPVVGIENSTSGFLILAGVNGVYPALAHHNSFLTSDEWGEFGDIFDRKCPPTDPTVGVSCQSVTDVTRAPSGMSNLFIMANVPALRPGYQWDTQAIADYRNVILQKLERMGLEGLKERIVVEQVWTPHDFVKRYNAANGALYGLSSNGWRQAFLRPAQRAKEFGGLYFAGGSTHPGGGLPLCILSGQIAARQLLENG